MAANAEKTISFLFLFELALNRLNIENKVNMNIVIVQANNIPRFISPVTLAMSSTKNTAVNPTIPNMNEVINHFVNLSILHTS